MASKLVLIGGGGHCHACIDVIESGKEFSIIGIIDKREKVGQSVLGYPIIGDDEDLPKIVNEDITFLITVGHIKSSKIREKLFNLLEILNANIATVISHYAIVSKYSKIAKGTIIMHRAIIGPNTQIGQNCIINTNATIEHDTIIGNNVHVSTHCVINGNCHLKDGTFIGSNSTLFNGIKISENIIVGAGSLVSKNIVDSGIYFGNPLIRKN